MHMEIAEEKFALARVRVVCIAERRKRETGEDRDSESESSQFPYATPPSILRIEPVVNFDASLAK